MKIINPLNVTFALLFVATNIQAQESLELETTIIKGNKEVPQILYMVPWQETNTSTKKEEQKLILHSLFGDLFDPILPSEPGHSDITQR